MTTRQSGQGWAEAAWVNGRVVDPAEPQILLSDHGLTVGDGVFETLPARDGSTFALTRHIERLRRSAAGMGLEPPEPNQVRAGVAAVLERSSTAGELRIRITYTSGPGPAGSVRGTGPQTLVVTTSRGRAWPASGSVAVAPWPRNQLSPLSGLKTTSYGENAVALAWARQHGHDEALLANLDRRLCEGTGSNVFVVVDGRLLTPPVSAGCLDGITRQLVLQWCGAQEQDLPVEVLDTAEEVFLTSSTRAIHPVHRVGERTLDIGPVTRRCQQVYHEQEARNPDP